MINEGVHKVLIRFILCVCPIYIMILRGDGLEPQNKSIDSR